MRACVIGKNFLLYNNTAYKGTKGREIKGNDHQEIKVAIVNTSTFSVRLEMAGE